MSTPAPWTKYREHAAANAFPDAEATAATMPGSEPVPVPFYMRAFTPNDSAEWARQMRGTNPAHDVKITPPTDSNPMQDAPYVMFASYDARGKYRTASHGHITKTHPYVITTYTEGDLVTEFYATAEARDRALFLLERAL